ncbi:Rx, N-terminal [Dillenia turbinata]|uniref:Rx, N-terminal n=1 Tax=Dillenia turbinata TaxID=194707 RepID=A0AAN8VTJ9_9MAGN
MGEPLLTAYLQPLLDKLAPGPLMNFAIQVGFDSELKKWRSMLRKIKLVLGDAEEKQMNDIEVKRWLDDLLLLAYDADDALDDFDYEALQQQNNSPSDPATSSNQLLDMLPLIKKITTRFQDIEEQKHDLGLEAKCGVRSSIINKRSETTSLLDASEIVGREQDVDAILKLMGLSETTGAEAHANPAFGMGGFGFVVPILSMFPSLQELRFTDVKNISNGLHCPTSLTELHIENCKNLRTLPNEIMSSNSNLQVLEIRACESLESFPSGVVPSTLDYLYFNKYPNLRSSPECLYTNLSVLRIEECESIESFPETGLPSPKLSDLIIRHCKNLKYLPSNLQKLTSLLDLSVMACDNLPEPFFELKILQACRLVQSSDPPLILLTFDQRCGCLMSSWTMTLTVPIVTILTGSLLTTGAAIVVEVLVIATAKTFDSGCFGLRMSDQTQLFSLTASICFMVVVLLELSQSNWMLALPKLLNSSHDHKIIKFGCLGCVVAFFKKK